MEHFRLTDEYRQQLFEAAAWSKAGVTPRLDEAKKKKKKDDDDEDDGESKGDKGKDKDDPDAKDYEDGGDRKGDESKTKKGKKDFVKEEEETTHVCPLCMSHLEEAIDEDSLIEHLDVVLGLVDRLSSMNEDDEDIDQAIDAALQDLLIGEDEE